MMNNENLTSEEQFALTQLRDRRSRSRIGFSIPKEYGEIVIPKIAVVACLHGNETFGLRVLEAIAATEELSDFTQVITNPEAVQLRKRIVNADMMDLTASNAGCILRPMLMFKKHAYIWFTRPDVAASSVRS
jgi:hypothetical protein